MRSYHLIFGYLLLVIGCLVGVLFLKEPPVWPDEVTYADIAYNLLHEHRLGTDLWGDMIPGVRNHALWYPPVFFYTLSGWIALFGHTITTQRMLSFACGCGTAFLFFLIARQIVQKTSKPSIAAWLPYTTTLALLIDLSFLKAMKVSRPEIVVLLLSFGTVYSLIKALDIEQSTRKKLFLTGISGLCASLAVLTHTVALFLPLGIGIFLVFTYQKQVFRQITFFAFSGAFLIPILVWFLSILPIFDLVKTQMILAAERKAADPSWLFAVFQTQPVALQLIYLGYFVISLLTIVFAIRKPRPLTTLIASLIISTWLFTLYGKMFWYFVLPLPFVYLGLTALLAAKAVPIRDVTSHFQQLKNHWQLVSLLLLLVFLTGLNTKLQSDLFFILAGNNYSYERYTRSILDHIPVGKTVFTSAIPDPYYALKSRDPHSKLYTFPVLKTTQGMYQALLDNSDYIIYNGQYEYGIFGALLPDYIKANELRRFLVGTSGQYQTVIVELKPRDQRMLQQ